jgi:uncharacterized protein YbjT (DUF2867 family)
MILVTGATGTSGRPLTDLLVTEGTTVRAVTRDPRPADLAGGIDPRRSSKPSQSLTNKENRL